MNIIGAMRMPHFVLRRLCIAGLLVFVLAPANTRAIGLRSDEPAQTPETLCKCAGDDSIANGGIRTFEEFKTKFGATFANPEELALAWKVYHAVNSCDATVVLGRLSQTGSFQNKPGYCVLRTLEGWTMRVNRAFLQGAIDRGAKIQLVSEMPPETMTGSEIDTNKVGPDDREADWIVIYNNEIQWVLQSGRYHLPNDRTKKISPDEPMILKAGSVKPAATATVATGKSGTLQLVEIKSDPPCETWKDLYTTCDAKIGEIMAKSTWGSATYNWTPPPDRIGPEGCSISLKASEVTPPSAPVATGINIKSSLEMQPQGATVAIGAPNQPLNGSTTVELKVPKNPTGDYYVTIGVYWGPGFTYHYRAQR